MPRGTATLRCSRCGGATCGVLVRRLPRGLTIVGVECAACLAGVPVNGGTLVEIGPARRDGR